MSANRVMGELPQDLADELAAARVKDAVTGGVSVGGGIPPTGALARALLRAEAELLVADAAAMAFGTYEYREPAQRRHDAFSLIDQRLQPHLRVA